MRPNPVQQALRHGRPVLSGWLTAGHPLVAEALAHAGFDAVTVDQQHGAVDDAELLSALQALSTTDTVPLVRVAWNEPGRIMKALDLGAYGVIAPMIEGADDVRALVSACRYPPRGRRSYGPTRAAFYGGPDYAAEANDTVLAIAMIETRAALNALDEVLSVPELDMVFVGPADLSQALGGPPGADFRDGPVPDALDHLLERAAAHGVPAGIFCKSPAYAREMLARGFGFVTADTDLGHLRARANEVVAAVRDGAEAGSTGR
ncbi:MAG: aldolase/citrate lyase family protein [Trueperaceae bacterium]|nr:aldolase/citrate lyase family protein [Trueperaceae bacterium]